MDLNRFLTGLADLFAAGPVDEKWVLAPSLRSGFQWLDTLTRAGRPVLNVRIKTLRNLAVDLASPVMARQGVGYASPRRLEAIIDGIFADLHDGTETYLGALTPSLGLTQTIGRVLRDLRLAAMTPQRIKPAAFESREKARDIQRLLTAYETRLRENALVDYADVLRLATERLRQDPVALSPKGVVICPSDTLESLSELEAEFWSAIPPDGRIAIPVDEPGCDKSTDLGRLSWLLSPSDAPLPLNDGSARMFRAVGEVNEVREVLRWCFEEGVPLDDVEVLHTDSQTYPTLIYETMSALQRDDAEWPPITLAEGLPVRCYRPGRALLAWLEWMSQDCPQMTLVRMLQDGLIAPAQETPGDLAPSRLAETLRSIPIGSGRDRYLSRLRSIAERTDVVGDDARTRDRARRLKALADLIESVLAVTPLPGAGQLDILRGAETFLAERARCVTEMENYAREKMLSEIREMAECLNENSDLAGFSAWNWLTELPHELPVGGLGPRPGCLYVAPLASGGHSGRGHTFILGLDDTRFPGSGLQDPLLLDDERRRLSKGLPTASARLEQRMDGFVSLLARLRGKVTLSYCCRSLLDDREIFASPAALSAYRILSGETEGDHESMTRWIGAPVSFAPRTEKGCLDQSEWWLWQLCGEVNLENTEEALGEAFPHLGRGSRALAARASDRFTEFDGYVPEAGSDMSPARPDARAISPTRLERFGACPLEYFFSDVLRIAPPEEHVVEPDVWLDAAERGSLMHEVFRRFMDSLRGEGSAPAFPEDVECIWRILGEAAAQAANANPPPNEAVYQREMNDLRFVARIFVYEEAEHCRETGAMPEFFEAAVGLPPEGEGTDLDTERPVSVNLHDGRRILARGRIDRIDRIGQASFAIWDYKTGSAYGYDRADPFRQGRRVQNVLYVLMAEDRIRERFGPKARVLSFGYFFPSSRERGERIAWPTDALRPGIGVVAALCDLLTAGCFPFTTAVEDVTYSDYGDVFDSPATAAEAIRRKLTNPENEMLAPFRSLRGVEVEEGDHE